MTEIGWAASAKHKHEAWLLVMLTSIGPWCRSGARARHKGYSSIERIRIRINRSPNECTIRIFLLSRVQRSVCARRTPAAPHTSHPRHGQRFHYFAAALHIPSATPLVADQVPLRLWHGMISIVIYFARIVHVSSKLMQCSHLTARCRRKKRARRRGGFVQCTGKLCTCLLV